MGDFSMRLRRRRLRRGCSGGAGMDSDIGMLNVRVSNFWIALSYQFRRAWSTGKTPAKAPHSVVMLAIANRSSTPSEGIPSPTNSIAAFRTSSWLKVPQRATMTSLPVTPFASRPLSSTLTIRGTCHHVFPVAHRAAPSVRTIGVPTQPTPPYMLL